MSFSYIRNIYALYIIKLSKWLMLIMPIVTLFYNENGLTELNIYLLQSIYSLSLAIMEIPSGYIADIWGRKKSLILGTILGTLGFFIYSYSHSLCGFIIAEIVLGIGGSCISGSDTAILFDTLDAVNRKEEYLRFEGQITAAGNMAETIAAILGGILAFWCSYRSVYSAQVLVSSIAIPAALLLHEPPVEKLSHGKEKLGLRHILSICRYALFEHKPLSAAILQSAVTGIATLSMAWTAQIYFVAQGFTEIAITPLWVSLNFIVAISSNFTPALEKKIRPQYGLLIIATLIPCGYISLGSLSTTPAIISLFIFYALRGYATPVLKNYTNLYCQSNVRATVFSIRSLIIRCGFALLAPAIGVIAEKTSFATALTYTGYMLLAMSLFSILFLYQQLGFLTKK